MSHKIKVTLNSKSLAKIAASGLTLRHPEYEFLLKHDDTSGAGLVIDIATIGQSWADDAHRLGVEAKIWDFLR
jgi:hypothetical protein